MLKKGVFELVFVVFLFVLLAPGFANASLGMTPAKVEMDFVPGYENTFDFRVDSDKPGQNLELYTEGKLSEYVSLSKKEIEQKGSFKVHVDLPSELEKPGKHRIIIGAKEATNEKEKEVKGMFGTKVKVQAVMEVFVPYPGRYVEIDLETENVNAGENTNFVLSIDNKGKEDVNISPRVDVYKDNEKVSEVDFYERKLESKNDIELEKEWNTTGYEPGDYRALGIVDYGKIAKDNESFRIGELFVDILNYSEKIKLGGLKKFSVDIESNWDDEIDSVYGNISFIENSSVFYSVKTSPEKLSPWEKSRLETYINTSKFEEKKYDVNITLNYKGRSSGEKREVSFYKEEENNMIYYAVVAVILVFIVLFWILRRKNEKK